MWYHYYHLWVRFVLVVVLVSCCSWRTVRPDVVTLADASSTFASSSSSSSSSSWWKQRWEIGQQMAQLEQQVEDYNAAYIASCGNNYPLSLKHRRLICLPLTDKFNPPMGVFSHEHIQTGDKISLPSHFWTAITVNKAEVPWLFAISRIDDITSERVQFVTRTSTTSSKTNKSSKKQEGKEEKNQSKAQESITHYIPHGTNLNCVVGGPLDFRAPSCYVFIPLWMMRLLGLRPYDIVQVELIETVPPGSLAKLRPHSIQFSQDISNPQAVLETELRHYSSLTKGSTIAFDYNKKRYWFDVIELRSAPRGEKVPMIKVQDCDIATDFLTSRDVLVQRQKEKQARIREQQQQE